MSGSWVFNWTKIWSPYQMAHDGSHLFISLEPMPTSNHFQSEVVAVLIAFPLPQRCKSTIHAESQNYPPSKKEKKMTFILQTIKLCTLHKYIYIYMYIYVYRNSIAISIVFSVVMPSFCESRWYHFRLPPAIWCHGHPTTPTICQGTVMKATNHWAPAFMSPQT